MLLFLHADTRLPEGAREVVAKALADGRFAWGVLLRWRLRFAYWRGVPASVLADSYR